MPERALATRPRDAAVPFQQRRGGARRESWELGLPAREDGDELLATPARVPRAEREERGERVWLPLAEARERIAWRKDIAACLARASFP